MLLCDAWQRLWRDDFTQNGKQVVNRLKIPQGLSTLMCIVGGVKFPQGEGSAVIHRKKNRPALQRRDILTVSLVSLSSFFLFFFSSFFFFFFFFFETGIFLNSSSAQFLVVLFFLAFYRTPFSSKHFLFLGLFLRSLSPQLFFLVVSHILLLSMTAFSYIVLLSLFWVWLFHAVFLSCLPPSSFLCLLSSLQSSNPFTS